MQLRHLLQSNETGKTISDESRRLIWQFAWEGRGLYVVQHRILEADEECHSIEVLGVYKRLSDIGQSFGGRNVAWGFALAMGETRVIGDPAQTIDHTAAMELCLRYTSTNDDGYDSVGEVLVVRHQTAAEEEAAVILVAPSNLDWSHHLLRVASVVRREDASAEVRKVFESEARDGNGDPFFSASNVVGHERLFSNAPTTSTCRSPSFGKQGLFEQFDLASLPANFFLFTEEPAASTWSESMEEDPALRLRLFNESCWDTNPEFELLVWCESHFIQ